jgi:hypothetical protein
MIGDPNRIVQCRNCGFTSTVEAADAAGPFCAGCDEVKCAFCGCTDTTPCFHPEHPKMACAWAEPGMCDFCFNKLAEESYIAVTTKIADLQERRIITL